MTVICRLYGAGRWLSVGYMRNDGGYLSVKRGRMAVICQLLEAGKRLSSLVCVLCGRLHGYLSSVSYLMQVCDSLHWHLNYVSYLSQFGSFLHGYVNSVR
jgi:hypothetical protein